MPWFWSQIFTMNNFLFTQALVPILVKNYKSCLFVFKLDLLLE